MSTDSNSHRAGLEVRDIALETRRLTKEFAGFVAVKGVDLMVRRGDIHALIGANGAGKTTCFNLLTKFLPPSHGQILMNGVDITGDRPQDIARKGMVRSFQISSIFPSLSVLENVRLGLQRATGTSMQFWRHPRVLARLDEQAMAALEVVGLEDCASLRAGDLPYGRKRALELAATLAVKPEILLLDEPTQGMGHEDVARVTQLIKRVAAGRTVLMVEHNMSVVSGICDRITVLQRGEVLAEGSYREIAANPEVRDAYMGQAHPVQGDK
jgi:branched-chain amino acid transport system ATP-binding protein